MSSPDKFLKITYKLQSGKDLHAYLKMPSPTYEYLKKEIEMYFFRERELPFCEIRTYWFDEQSDEIEIINQCDYDIFMAKFSKNRHIYVAPIKNQGDDNEEANQMDAEAATPQAASDNVQVTDGDGDPAEFVIHHRVECDNCLISPIVGFRYKCIECENFDLCQHCEAKHVHAEHMMVRMPNNDCPNVVETWITSHSSSGRKHSKRSKGNVNLGLGAAVINDNKRSDAKDSGSENGTPSNGRRRRRRHQRHGIWTHIYDMMQDLAEGGTYTASTNNFGEKTDKQQQQQQQQQQQKATMESIGSKVAAAAATAAHEAAAGIAAKVAHETAMQAAKNMLKKSAPTTETKTNTSNQSTEAPNDKANDAGSTEEQGIPSAPAVPLPVPVPLDALAQFLDPQFMKTGIQILNNFSDMFSKMLDPMDEAADDGDDIYHNSNSNNFANDLRKNSANSNNLSDISSNKSNSDDNDTNIEKPGNEKVIEDIQEKVPANANEPQDMDLSYASSISDNDSSSESFIKIDSLTLAKSAVANSNSNNTNIKENASITSENFDLNKSKTTDFAQLSASLKAHIAQEAAQQKITVDNVTITETDTDQKNEKPANKLAFENNVSVSVGITNAPVIPKATADTSTLSRSAHAEVIYHSDERINNAVIAMMGMGFSNEGAWLTQLLESVQGNIPEALDLMSAAQRNAN
uniref:ZZ-type domain-containing protein n=1 Tax=Glossina brevipalpis TaxID=37001 RepID=A0A1A9W6U2_9MUSC